VAPDQVAESGLETIRICSARRQGKRGGRAARYASDRTARNVREMNTGHRVQGLSQRCLVRYLGPILYEALVHKEIDRRHRDVCMDYCKCDCYGKANSHARRIGRTRSCRRPSSRGRGRGEAQAYYCQYIVCGQPSQMSNGARLRCMRAQRPSR
jgi:hypothetical protein